jgi:hypothetical protein
MNKTAVATVLVLGIVLINNCGGTEAPKSDVPPRSYEMRGMVRQISTPDAEERQIWIHHEAIPEFVDIRGNTAPMEVSFRLDVDWSAGVPARIASVELLPVETELGFEASTAEEPAEHGDH